MKVGIASRKDRHMLGGHMSGIFRVRNLAA